MQQQEGNAMNNAKTHRTKPRANIGRDGPSNLIQEVVTCWSPRRPARTNNGPRPMPCQTRPNKQEHTDAPCKRQAERVIHPEVTTSIRPQKVVSWRSWFAGHSDTARKNMSKTNLTCFRPQIQRCKARAVGINQVKTKHLRRWMWTTRVTAPRSYRSFLGNDRFQYTLQIIPWVGMLWQTNSVLKPVL
jgi:hypothetical protein